jgi:condensin complex subunit 1
MADPTAASSEIAAKQFSAQDSKGPRSFSKFVTKLAELSPRLVLKQISLLQKHLDSEVCALYMPEAKLLRV